MKNNLVARLYRKIKKIIFGILGYDHLTLTKTISRNDLIKIGTKYGGWVVPRLCFNEKSICYCAGCGEDISFDIGLINTFGCDVFGFDPTPRAIKHVKAQTHNNSRYTFLEIGLWDKKDVLEFFEPKNPKDVSHSLLNLQNTGKSIKVNVDSLENIMVSNHHERLDLLKLDIEGAEYKVIQSIIDSKIEVKVLCVEYDEYFNPIDNNYRNRIKESIKSLMNLNYAMVHTEGNGNYTFVKNP